MSKKNKSRLYNYSKLMETDYIRNNIVKDTILVIRNRFPKTKCCKCNTEIAVNDYCLYNREELYGFNIKCPIDCAKKNFQ